ncbi:MAG TPA: type II secretion system F family protein [Candidatus Nanoarchaeia archaeon]|nr:type II secretion system F family protein [Candidatus Nanoarchaeia archaeon]
MRNVEEICRKLSDFAKELNDYKAFARRLETETSNLSGEDRANKEYQLDQVNLYIMQILESMEILCDMALEQTEKITAAEEEKIIIPVAKPAEEPKAAEKNKEEAAIPLPSGKFVAISAKAEQSLIDELGLDKRALQRLRNVMKKPEKERAKYSIYKPKAYGKLANSLFDGLQSRITAKNPKIFDSLYKSLMASDVKVLSRTYINMIFLTTLFASFLGLIGGVALFSFLGKQVLIGGIAGVLLAFLVGAATYILLYTYPWLAVTARKKRIRNDLPFMIIHMAAVAGSGAHPMSIFGLLLRSGEYKGLEEELTRIVNYTNLFGYDLTTALKTVSKTTPSMDFRELLTGIASTVESGGNLAVYLKSKANDAMNKYRLERKKYVETLSTYSDIYTGVLIAAPLLFIVTLAIINLLGGSIGGFTVKSISSFGTFIIIPFLNIGFIIFLTITQPEL